MSSIEHHRKAVLPEPNKSIEQTLCKGEKSAKEDGHHYQHSCTLGNFAELHAGRHMHAYKLLPSTLKCWLTPGLAHLAHETEISA
jgi:hypothetical protein